MSNIDDRIIELKELRIGNLLEYKGELMQVTSLSCDIDDEYQDQICFVKFGTSTNEKGGWNRSLVNDLKRIPLSAEWLYRIAKPNIINHSWDLGYKEATYVTRLFDDGVYVGVKIESNERFPDKSFAWGLKYVHQLQNLYFALTNEELTIKEPI